MEHLLTGGKKNQLVFHMQGAAALHPKLCTSSFSWYLLSMQGARQAYEKAYKISVMVSGADTPPTLDIKALVEKVPTSANELRARYNSDGRKK